jgi:hypothetical protein
LGLLEPSRTICWRNEDPTVVITGSAAAVPSWDCGRDRCTPSQLSGQDDVLGAHEVWRRIDRRSDRAQVYGDRYGSEAETFVERSGRGVEGITAGADLEDFDPVGAHVGDGVLAEALADVVASVEWRHGKEIDLAVSPFGVDSPGDEADDRALSEGGYGCVAARLGRMECWKLVAVVLFPVPVLVLEDLFAEVGTGVAFEEGSEGLDEQVGGRGVVVDLEWPDVHCKCLSSERTGTARA